MLCQIIHVVLTWFFAMTLPCPAPTRPLANSSLPLAGLGFGLYLFGVVSSYAASTIYHAIPASRASSKAIARKLDNAAIFWHIALWVVGEGIAYITGAVLYSFKKIPYIHSVFHVFVILGDICHMVATWKMIQLFIK